MNTKNIKSQSRYKVTISEELLCYLAKDSRKKDPKKLTKLEAFSLLCRLSYLLKLQDPEAGVPVSDFEAATRWARPVTGGFLKALGEMGVIKFGKEGRQKFVSLRPEIFALSEFCPSDGRLPQTRPSSPTDVKKTILGPSVEKSTKSPTEGADASENA
ncbi:MAG: hypothetical protein PUD15_08575 [Prevotella sp.]|nr:hypothetical protein [Prevotella sp.]